VDGGSDSGSAEPESLRSVRVRGAGRISGGTRLAFTIHQSMDSDSKLEAHMLVALRLSATTNASPLKVSPLNPEQRKLLAIAPEKRSAEQQRELFSVFRRFDPGLAELNKQIADAWTNWPYPATTLVLHQREHPRVTRLFKRGIGCAQERKSRRICRRS